MSAPLVLAIESSCDETGIAVVEAGRRIQANVVASQVALHAREPVQRAHADGRHHVEARGVDLRDDEGVLEIRRACERLAIRCDDAAAAPECDAILHPNPIAVENVGRQQFSVRAQKTIDALSARELFRHPIARARGNINEEIRTILPQHIRRRNMPRVLAHHQPHPPQPRIKGPE